MQEMRKTLKALIKNADFIILYGIGGSSTLVQQRTKNRQKTIVDAIASLIKLTSKEQRIVIPTTNSGYGVGQKGVMH